MTHPMTRTGRMPLAAGARQQGFVLIAVLGLIMVLSLVAAFVSDYAEQQLMQAQQVRTDWQNQLDQQATQATLLHLVATRERASQGYELTPKQAGNSLMNNTNPNSSGWASNSLTPAQPQVAADGRAYVGVGQSDFALQDEGALISLLDPKRDHWQIYLNSLGLSPLEAERVLDLIDDYTDKDDLRRLNGAQDADYVAKGLTPPAHRYMIGPGQVYNLLDAGQWPWLPRLLPQVTARSGGLINLNTMPVPLLAALPGLDQQTANELELQRRQQPFSSLQDANQRLGKLLPIDALKVPQVISPFVRIMVWNSRPDGCRQVRWLGVSLSPSSILAPWELDYAFTYHHDDPCPTAQPVVVAPLFQPAVAN